VELTGVRAGTPAAATLPRAIALPKLAAPEPEPEPIKPIASAEPPRAEPPADGEAPRILR
jgi:hypothetical protein